MIYIYLCKKMLLCIKNCRFVKAKMKISNNVNTHLANDNNIILPIKNNNLT